MQTQVTTITEQCGAVWTVWRTNVNGERAFWVFLVRGKSAAKPAIIGFYAPSINAVCDALNN